MVNLKFGNIDKKIKVHIQRQREEVYFFYNINSDFIQNVWYIYFVKNYEILNL